MNTNHGRSALPRWSWITFILFVLVAISFGILAPFIWRLVFDERPPTAAFDLSSLLSVLVAIIAVTVAGFGITVYGIIRASLKGWAEELQGKLKEELGAHADAMANLTLGQIDLRQGMAYWVQYEEAWANEGYPCEPGSDIAALAEKALEFSERTLRFARKLPELQNEESMPSHAALLRGALNCTAYHLATLQTDRIRAELLAAELDAREDRSLHDRETAVWVSMRFTRPETEERQKATERLEALWRDFPVDLRSRYRPRYKGVLGLELAD